VVVAGARNGPVSIGMLSGPRYALSVGVGTVLVGAGVVVVNVTGTVDCVDVG
jgi:hypothetical protein